MPQVQVSWGLVLNEGQIELETDRRIGATPAVILLYRTVLVKEQLSRKPCGRFTVGLQSSAQRWSCDLGHGKKYKIANTSDGNEFPPQGCLALP